MAMFLNDKKILFLHIPRTGGTFLVKVIRKAKLSSIAWIRSNRAKLTQSHQLIGHFTSRYRRDISGVSAFVRHPITYYESVWMFMHVVGDNRWLMGRDRRFSWHPHSSVVECWRPDFADWVRAVIDELPGWYSRLVDMYVGPDGGEFCKYIGRTERINIDLVDILIKFGYELTDQQKHIINGYRVINHSYDRDRADVQAMLNWTDELKDAVCETEKEVIHRFYGKNENKLQFIPMRVYK